MKSFRVTTSPFKKREFYSDADIESICSEALKKSGLYPTEPSAVRIERFIESRYGLVPQFEDLKRYGVMGVTLFGKNGPTEMLVDQSLSSEEPFVRNRYFSTLAHEAGHCLFHTHLFALNMRKGNEACLCRHECGEKTYKGEWWEYQANRAIGSLLLPEHIFKIHLKSLGVKDVGSATNEILQRTADIFSVNKAVARLRLNTIRF